MNLNEAIVRIREAGGNASCVPMSEGDLYYKIAAGDKIIAENLTKQEAERIIQQAKNRILID